MKYFAIGITTLCLFNILLLQTPSRALANMKEDRIKSDTLCQHVLNSSTSPESHGFTLSCTEDGIHAENVNGSKYLIKIDPSESNPKASIIPLNDIASLSMTQLTNNPHLEDRLTYTSATPLTSYPSPPSKPEEKILIGETNTKYIGRKEMNELKTPAGVQGLANTTLAIITLNLAPPISYLITLTNYMMINTMIEQHDKLIDSYIDDKTNKGIHVNVKIYRTGRDVSYKETITPIKCPVARPQLNFSECQTS